MIEVIIGKSGSGKSTYLKNKLKNNKNLILLDKWTTRKPRKDDFEYNFCNERQFIDKLSRGDLLEWVKFNDNYYGVENFDFDKNKDYIIILEKKGLETFKKVFGIKNIKVTNLKIPEEERIKRLKNLNDIDRLNRNW